MVLDRITVKLLRDAEWKLAYHYPYVGGGADAGFKTYVADSVPGVTVTHDRKIGSKRTVIYYTVDKKRTDSPEQTVRWFNEAKQREQGGRDPAGSPKSAKRSRTAAGARY